MDLSQTITSNDVENLRLFPSSWMYLQSDTVDPTQRRLEGFKYNVNRLSAFAFNEEQSASTGTNNYLYLRLGDEKEDDKDNWTRKKMEQTQFEMFMARLLMFIKGHIVKQAPTKPISEMYENDAVALFRSHQEAFIQSGMGSFCEFEQILSANPLNRINGAKLMAAYEAMETDPNAMGHLLFGDQQIYDSEKQYRIANQIFKVIDAHVLRDKVQSDIIPKFDLCKKIAKHRLLYYSEGGRDALDKNRRIGLDQTMEEFEQIERDWKDNVLFWRQNIEELRSVYKVLAFFTVNDMRWIISKIPQCIIHGSSTEKAKHFGELHSSLCFIDSSLGLEECKRNVIALWQRRQPRTLQELGDGLQKRFGWRLRECITATRAAYQYLAFGKPHLFYCQQNATLRTVMRLFLSQKQHPAASRVLFCSSTTTLEELECLLMRSNPSDDLLLDVLVQPEQLQSEIQDCFLRIVRQYVHKNRSLFAIVTSDTKNKIYHELVDYLNYTLPSLSDKEFWNNFNTILCSRAQTPLYSVYISQKECVGKSHVIRQFAKDNGYQLIHIPINTKPVDTDFIVDRLTSGLRNRSEKTAFHIDVSSAAGRDVNKLMFQLLVLRYLRGSNGASFTVNGKHAFLVELPTHLSTIARRTNIDDVRERFHFLVGPHIPEKLKFEVQDTLQQCQPIVLRDRVILNQLQVTAKEMFVFKYIDAYEQKKLLITGNSSDDWNRCQHADVPPARQKMYIEKYCPQCSKSTVLLKSFLHYMYRQLIQLYSADVLVKNELAVPMPGSGRKMIFFATNRWVQYHTAIMESLLISAPHFACRFYEIPWVLLQDNGDMSHHEDTDLSDGDYGHDSRKMDETTGEEEFFLVKYWAQSSTPMVLLNQQLVPQRHFLSITAGSILVDLRAAAKANVATYSLLTMGLSDSDSFGAKEWKFLSDTMQTGTRLDLDIYNFEEDTKGRTALQQKLKLKLLLRICGGFACPDPDAQERQLQKLYAANKDYVLIFDNVLKIVAIYFRINSGIPLLIMGETGCGKTRLISFMATALGLKMFSIDVHGGYSIPDLQRDLLKPVAFAQENATKTVLVFLDKINTSPAVGVFKEVICDHSLKGEKLPKNMVIIASLNPYRQRHKTMMQIEEEKWADANNPRHSVDDLDRQMGSLVYRVFPLPPSLKTYVWNFGALSQVDERQYIIVMTRTTWHSQCPIPTGLKRFQSYFIEMIRLSQQYVRKELNDVSVCSLRDVRRANKLLIWFWHRGRNTKQPERRIVEAMLLAIAHCYYYRLNQKQRLKFCEAIDRYRQNKLSFPIAFVQIIVEEQNKYVNELKIEPGIAINRAFRENLFVMLVGIATKTPTVVIGKPGSSKTLAMSTLYKNLASSTRNKALSKLGFDDDYFVGIFQCTKLTKMSRIESIGKWAAIGITGSGEIVFVDEMGLAERAPDRPMQVLHSVLENPKFSFIGASRWSLDATKMNRVVLHQSLPPNKEDLMKTAEMLMRGDGDLNTSVRRKLESLLPRIAAFYHSILEDKRNNPFGFDFFGHRDFYKLVSYLKYRLQQRGVSLEDDMVLVEAVLRNFGGETKQQAERFLLPKIAEHILSTGMVDTEQLWKKFNPLSLIRDNIRQTRDLQRPKSYELRNILLIADSPAMWKILYDANVLQIADTEVVFGSKFKNDIEFDFYLHRTIDKIRGVMESGRTCVLLKLDKLYESLYDVLNQRYDNVDGQKSCGICIGYEEIPCQIHHAFRCIVVQSRGEAHHLSKNTDDFTCIAFLNRFEKQYLDPTLLQEYGFGGDGWSRKWQLLKATINRKYADHLAWRTKDLFIGFNKTCSFVSLLTTEAQSEHIEHKDEDDDDEGVENAQDDQKVNDQESIDECYKMLLRTTSIQYLIQNQRKVRKRDFVAYGSLIDLVQREGVQNDSRDHVLLRVVTHDTYQPPRAFNHKLKDKDYDGMRVKVNRDTEENQSQEDAEQKEQPQSASDVHIIKFKEIDNFLSESEFSHYIHDFLSDRNTVENTLVIMCDPVTNEDQLVHYLHAQYLIEKARGSFRRNVNRGPKRNIVFLIYMSRQAPYPLIFNREWKHLFLDALLPADHDRAPEIQINDINIFDHNDRQKLQTRVSFLVETIVHRSYWRAANVLEFPQTSNVQQEIHRMEKFLDIEGTIQDGGRFRKVLKTLIESVLTDERSGAIDCLKKTLKDLRRADRGSMRSHFMEKLSDLVREKLAGILLTVFSNENSTKYQGGDTRMEALWLKLLSEPTLLRASERKKDNRSMSIRFTINQLQFEPKFPFSNHIHSYLSSYEADCLRAWRNESVSIIDSGNDGQRFLMQQIALKLQAANVKTRLDDFPESWVHQLTFDVLHFEADRLGLNLHGHVLSELLVHFIGGILFKLSRITHEDRVMDITEENEEVYFEEESSDDDDFGDLVIGSDEEESEDDDHVAIDIGDDTEDEDEDSNDDDHDRKSWHEDEKEEEKDEKKQEERGVQIHEIYAAMWANEKIILQIVDLLSALRSAPGRMETINEEWLSTQQDFAESLGTLLNRFLEAMWTELTSYSDETRNEAARNVMAVKHSFMNIISDLKLRYHFDVAKLQNSWAHIHLAAICVSASDCIPWTFITDFKTRLDDSAPGDVGVYRWYFDTMSQLISDYNQRYPRHRYPAQWAMNGRNKNETLQWLWQNCIRLTFNSPRICVEMVQYSIYSIFDSLSLVANGHSKLECALQIIQCIERKEDIRYFVFKSLNACGLNSEIAIFLTRASEIQHHCDLRKRYNESSIAAPSKSDVAGAENELKTALNSANILGQVLAISRCKVLLYYFSRYLHHVLTHKGKIHQKGIKFKGRTCQNASYLKIIGRMLMIPNGCSRDVRAVKQGLQYYFVSEIWKRYGAQNTIHLISNPVFPKLLSVQLSENETEHESNAAEYIPRDDTFLLAIDTDDEKEAQIKSKFDDAVMKDMRPAITFQREYYIYLIGAIFKYGYLMGGRLRSKDIAAYIYTDVSADSERLSSLLTNLLTNKSSDPLFKLSAKRTLEDVQMIRLCLHFLAAILSLPQSPFSRLFHCPHEMKKEYIPGMPDDSSSELLKAMAGHAVWLCPNDHIYFVANNAQNRAIDKCATCGANIGNEASSTGNRKIGVVSSEGKIIPESNGSRQSTALYENDKLAPKGYVMTESTDEVIREMDAISVVVIRWMNHAALFVHGTEAQMSKAAHLMQVRPDEVTKTARTQLMKGMRKLQSKLDLSFESVMYLMHQIIHNVHSKFTAQWGADGIPKVEDPKLRKDLERWLVNECIRPVIQNATAMIGSVREKVSTSVTVLKWAKRFEGRVDLRSNDGKTFAKDYLPNIFLPFRLLTLSTFKEKFLERNENKSKYPVTWGILNTIDTAAGYSVFALKHLPAMITWMKLVKQRLNQRLDLDEILKDPEMYSCQWVMDKCVNEKYINLNERWVDIRVWKDAFNGFVKGWNHLAQRVTTDEDHVGLPIANVSQALLIKPLVSGDPQREDVIPADLPIYIGIDTGLNGKLDSSIVIRKIIEHYINVNNEVRQLS